MTSIPEATARSRDWRRPLRYLWRVPLLVLHVVVGLSLTMLMINPICARITQRGESLDQLAIRWWSIGMMRVFGMRRLFVGALGLFTFASIGCALSVGFDG